MLKILIQNIFCLFSQFVQIIITALYPYFHNAFKRLLCLIFADVTVVIKRSHIKYDNCQISVCLRHSRLLTQFLCDRKVFLRIPYLSRMIPCSYWALACIAVLPSCVTLYMISVRQARGLPVVSLFPHPASFRFHLAMDTLAFGCILPTTGRIRDFHPLETCAARRTIRPAAVFATAVSLMTVNSIILSPRIPNRLW